MRFLLPVEEGVLSEGDSRPACGHIPLEGDDRASLPMSPTKGLRPAKGIPKCPRLVIRASALLPDGTTVDLKALIDTGAEVNLIHSRVLPSHLLRHSPNPVRLGTANGQPLPGGDREVTFQLLVQGQDLDGGGTAQFGLPITAYNGDTRHDLIVSYG